MKLLSGIIELKPGWFVQLPYPMTQMEMARYRFDAAALLLAGTGIAAAGQLQAGRAAEAESESAKNIASYNAAVQEQEARAIKQKAEFEQKRQSERAERIKGKQLTSIAKAGGILSPVATDLSAEQAAELELENLLIGYEAATQARRAENQAELDRLQGKLYGRKGKAAKQASFFRAGSTLLTGFGVAKRGSEGWFKRPREF